MHLKNIFSGLFILVSVSLFAENNSTIQNKIKDTYPPDSIQLGIDYLKKYIQPSWNGWQSDYPEIMQLVKGLIHFAEDEHIDSILVKLERFQKIGEAKYINRSPKFVRDSLKVNGYLSNPAILEKMMQLDREIWNNVDLKTISLPASLKSRLDQKLKEIAPGDVKAIIKLTGIVLPDSLKEINAVPDSVANSASDQNRIRTRDQLLEKARLKYNQQIKNNHLDSAINAYRTNALRVFSEMKQNQLRDSLKLQNQKILTSYNDSVVRSVNDNINKFVKSLQRYAQNDSVRVWVHSLSGKPSPFWLRNNQRSASRLFIKNVQNDSIAIRLMNLDKHSFGIAIDDDITFNRIAQKPRRDFVFEKAAPDHKLKKIPKRYNVVAPWDYGGDGTFGFTQTYLNNWKAGGRSSFAFLMVLKGYANYSNDKLKWENTGEIRDGWIRQGGDVDQTQKNDDKIELISRLGVSAFKKWYYSSEIDFVTQFFTGYDYPDKSVLISGFMSPAKTLIKLGLDYKPNKNFSLFLSPITAKNVFVRDTSRIDQTQYGVSSNSRSFWEPGLNIDLKYKIDLTPRISYETKYKMFMNYQDPFEKIDINWENTMVAQLTDRINMTFMLYMLYDDNVTFDTGKIDSEGNAIYKAKWQTRELTTIGFSYKINRHIYKRNRIGN